MHKGAHFSMHWGRQCSAPMRQPNVRPRDAPKGASPSLGRGVYLLQCCRFWLPVCKQNALQPPMRVLLGALGVVVHCLHKLL